MSDEIHNLGATWDVDDNDFKSLGLSPENVNEMTKAYLHKLAEEQGLTEIKAPVPKVPGDLRIIGGFIGDLDWWCQFEFIQSDRWVAHFLDESDNWTDLYGEGETPRAAFDSVVQRYKILNGGSAGYVMRRILPELLKAFTDEGTLHPSILGQLEHTEGVWI